MIWFQLKYHFTGIQYWFSSLKNGLDIVFFQLLFVVVQIFILSWNGVFNVNLIIICYLNSLMPKFKPLHIPAIIAFAFLARKTKSIISFSFFFYKTDIVIHTTQKHNFHAAFLRYDACVQFIDLQNLIWSYKITFQIDKIR